MPEGRIVKAKSTRTQSTSSGLLKELAQFCYFFPAYTLETARKVPIRHIRAMMNVVRQEQASDYLMLLNISAAPHTKKGAGVKKLQRELGRIVDG